MPADSSPLPALPAAPPAGALADKDVARSLLAAGEESSPGALPATVAPSLWSSDVRRTLPLGSPIPSLAVTPVPDPLATTSGATSSFEATPSVTWLRGLPAAAPSPWRHRRIVALVVAAILGTALGIGARVVFTVTNEAPAYQAAPSSANEPGAASADEGKDHRQTPPANEDHHHALLEKALVVGTTTALDDVARTAAMSWTEPAARATWALATAFGALEHGSPALDEGVLARLEALRRDADVNKEEAEAAVLMATLATGDREKARRLATSTRAPNLGPWLPYARARALRDLGNLEEARRDLDAALTKRFPPHLALAVQMFVDAGDVDRAASLLADADWAAENPRFVMLGAEVRGIETTLPQTAGPARKAAIERNLATLSSACGDAAGADVAKPTTSPNLRATCLVLLASHTRRAGRRRDAHTIARSLTPQTVTDPRALIQGSLLLANLGETDRAKAWLARATDRVAAEGPGIAAASMAIDLGRGMMPNADRLASVPAPVGAEARLFQARAALATAGRPGLQAALADSDTSADADLGWYRWLVGIGGDRERARASTRLLAVRRPVGPVAAYVAGLLAGSRRHLAALWLARALEGHGDRCLATRRYADVLRQLGRKPGADPTFVGAARAGGCQ
jgi:tetratricopeptide (TPR) repeat protein